MLNGLGGRRRRLFQDTQIALTEECLLLGAKQQAETVAYMSHFDICINPQLINEITVGNYPRKVDEYLALGKPVVATRTKTMEIFDNYVLNCLGASEYIQAIRKALQEHNPDATKRRIEFAHTHTWENSVSKLYDYIIRAQQYVTIQTKTKIKQNKQIHDFAIWIITPQRNPKPRLWVKFF